MRQRLPVYPAQKVAVCFERADTGSVIQKAPAGSGRRDGGLEGASGIWQAPAGPAKGLEASGGHRG